MITKNKLADQKENKLTNKFKPIDLDDGYEELPGGKPRRPRHVTAKKTKKRAEGAKVKKHKWSPVVLLPLLLVAVAAATYGVAHLMQNNTKPAGDALDQTDAIEEVFKEISEKMEDGPDNSSETAETEKTEEINEDALSIQSITSAPSDNPTIKYGRLMLINPNYTVDSAFIAARKSELVSLQSTYGILELHSYNGDNLLDKEAAAQINKMLSDYTIANPGHSIQTVSCFREVGTNCGRLCAATGASDHHTGLTCDLIDPVYGTSLDTATYEQHLEWQWLRANSYKYGFIDRFPEKWAGGSMDEPLNVNAEGSTGLYETWHFRYVGVYAATQIATGVYNNGEYDSLEHYLLARGLVTNLLNP